MNLVVKEIKSQSVWDNFAKKFKPNNFLTSWQWTDFNNEMGDTTLRLGLYDKRKLVAICAASITKSKKGNFLLSPAGPLLGTNSKKHWQFFTNYLKSIAKERKLKFVRIRPLFLNLAGEHTFKNMNFKNAPVRVPAESSLILDLDKDEVELLNQMRKTTRYLIKKAEKDGVLVTASTKEANLKLFHRLEINTVAKHKFIPFSEKYVLNQFRAFIKTNDALIFLAKYKGKVISSAIITFFGDSAFYNHGASIDTKIPASYAIQWEAIKEAKRRGKKFYNFWGGIAPTNNPKHPWTGITLFKAGFGGQLYETVHARDIATSKLYHPISLFEKVRYRIRGHSV